MSSRVPGYSQPDMISLWKKFMDTNLRKTRFRTVFNGKERAVYSDGSYLYVLDEWHGDLEVLQLRERPGNAEHLGSREIIAVFEPADDGSVPTVTEVKMGELRSGGVHKYVLTGSRY